MNRRQTLQALAALALPASSNLIGAIRGPPAVPVDWVARYSAVYRPEFQAMTNVCTHNMANIGMHAVSLNVQGVVSPLLSAGYGYFQDTGDRTFTLGSWSSKAARQREGGTCVDALYSQEYLITHWQNGFPYPVEFLPQPACYADAPSHRLLDWSYLAIGRQFGAQYAPDMALIRQLLRAGYPVTFGIERHAICVLNVDNDGWWYTGFDSRIGGLNEYGLGAGVRQYSQDVIERDGWDFCAYLEVSSGTAPTPPSQAALISQIRADAAALADPPTAAQRDTLRAHVDQLQVAP